MVTTLNFKDIIDLPKWRPIATSPTTTATASGWICDFRNNEDRHPLIYFRGGPGLFFSYNVKTDEWLQLADPVIGPNYNAGFFMSAQGPRGTIAAGATTTSIPLTTALPVIVGVNQLANRGDGRGFKVRIIGNSAGSSGKTEERLVIANTGQTTTPTLLLDSPLSFVPANGDAYEFLSGKVYMLTSSPTFKFYDVLTNSVSGALSTVGMSTGNSFCFNLVGLDELLVPYDRNPGEGFFGILTATATTGTTLTGTVGATDSFVANQYRNFQIRIVEDTGTPLSVGQRRNITSSAIVGGAMQYTVSAWTTNPSATAKYVIENNGDRIIQWASGTTVTSTYTISTNTWDSNVTFDPRPIAAAAGFVSQQAFAIEPDTASPPNARQSFIYTFRGGSSSVLDLFDIAGAAKGIWTSGITFGNSGLFQSLVPTSSTLDPATNQGRYMYINSGVNVNFLLGRFYRLDMKNRVLENSTFLRVPLTTGAITNTPTPFLAYTVFVDGNTKLSFIYFRAINVNGIDVYFQLPITR